MIVIVTTTLIEDRIRRPEVTIRLRHRSNRHDDDDYGPNAVGRRRRRRVARATVGRSRQRRRRRPADTAAAAAAAASRDVREPTLVGTAVAAAHRRRAPGLGRGVAVRLLRRDDGRQRRGPVLVHGEQVGRRGVCAILSVVFPTPDPSGSDSTQSAPPPLRQQGALWARCFTIPRFAPQRGRP